MSLRVVPLAPDAQGGEAASAALDEAAKSANLVCDAAESALTDGVIVPDSLISSWERRREAHLAAADLVGGPAARRAAWQQYAEAVRRRLAVVEPLFENGDPGGEAEGYHLLRSCAAKADAALAKADGGGAAELSAVTSGAGAGEMLVEATKTAFEAEMVTVEQYVDAINRRAAAERRLAQLRPDASADHDWQQRQAAALHDLTSKLNALRLVSDGGYDSCKLSYSACQYALVRCRMAEKAEH